MRKRLAGLILLVLSLMFVCAGYVQADFVQSGANTMYQTQDGTYLKGLQNINGEWYYFDPSGFLRKSGWIQTTDGKEYYATDSGVLARNQWMGKVYLKDDGEKAKGITKIGNHLYYFSMSSGKLQKGKLKDSEGNLYITNGKGVVYSGRFFKYKKKNYYAGEDGKLAKGLTKIGIDYYFFSRTSGKMLVGRKKKVDGYTYYLTKTGKAARDRWIKLKGKYYYFQSDGRMATNMYIGSKWYVGANGVRKKATSIPKTGVQKVDGKIYIYDKSGNMIKGQWIKVEKDTYYTGTDGAALTGLQTIESKQYYFDEDGVLKTSTVVKADGVSYMAGEDGQLTSLSDASGAAIAAFAQKYVGNPYVYGGTSLTQGADCSGFCYTVFQTFGIQLMRVADDQMKGPSEAYQKLGYKKGVVVSDKNLEPGDLVFYGSASYASHVAIYIGDNKVVHAANSRLGIIISDMDYVRSRVKNKSMRYWA